MNFPKQVHDQALYLLMSIRSFESHDYGDFLLNYCMYYLAKINSNIILILDNYAVLCHVYRTKHQVKDPQGQLQRPPWVVL